MQQQPPEGASLHDGTDRTARALSWIAVRRHRQGLLAECPEELHAVLRDVTERFLCIGTSAADAVQRGYEAGRLHLDLSDIPANENVSWENVTADLRKAGMTDFLKTPHGFVLLDAR
ncbi:hypothetical protein ACWF94_16410 [Streptomyces sp. NPDC055078]